MHHTTSASLFVVLPLFFIACGDKEDTGDPYCPPSAYAGVDQSLLLGATTDLDATQTAELDDGTVLASGYPSGCNQDVDHTFHWKFMSLPVESLLDESALTDNNSQTASVSSFTPDAIGTYVLSLVVCDDIGDEPCSAADVVAVTVSSDDAIPVAEAGDAQTVDVGDRADLDGTESYDPDGSDLEYSWALGSTPSCSELGGDDLYNASTATPSLICDCEGIYVVSLAVNDGMHWSEPDHVKVTCNSGNSAPVADAGDTEALSPCTDFTIELNGFGSYDPDGDELTFQWNVVTVPNGSLADDSSFSDTTVPNPEFTWDVPGDYTFELQVFDGEFWSAPDVVTLTFVDISENQKPTANAGEPETAEVESECTSTSYVWSCDACNAVEFDLDGTASYDDDGDTLTYLWEAANSESSAVSIASPTTALATALTPEVEATYGTGQTTAFDLKLTVADCADNDTDTVKFSVTCTGVN